MVQAERDYSDRDVVDKLGIKEGHRVAFDERLAALDPGLSGRCLERAGTSAWHDGELEPADVVLVAANEDSLALLVERLNHWRSRLRPNGGIWVMTPKRGQAGYVDQRHVIATGLETGLVDNKSCSVSEQTSGVRFVYRRSDRPKHTR